MELINDRYRVIKILSDDYYITRYLVADVLNKLEKLCINVINKEYVSKKFIDFLKEEFITLKASNGKGIINIYDFGIIHNIDGANINETMYYYSSEYFEGGVRLSEKYNDISSKDKFLVFAQICTEVNTLYLKGILYNNLRTDNIYITNKKDNYICKLKDIISFFMHQYTKESIHNRANRTIDEYTTNHLKKEIKAIGNLALRIFDKEIKADNNEAAKRLYNHFCKADKYGEYIDIFSIINDLKKILSSELPPFYKEEVSRLNIKNKIVGRADEIKYVIDKYHAISAGQSSGVVIGIHGENGIGKTRFLQEIIYQFKLMGCNVFYDGFQKNIGANSNLLNIIKRMLGELDNEKVKKYEEQWENIITKDVQEDRENFDSMMHEKMEKYKIINRLSSMIIELSRTKPIIFVFDDINSFKQIYTDIIEYLFSEEGINALVVFSYEDSSVSLDNRFAQFHKNMLKSKSYSEIKLRELKLEGTIEMISNILSAPYNLNNLGTRIHSITYGNPLFIEEVAKNLFLTKEIYRSDENGLLTTDRNEIMEINIPTDMEEATWNQIKGVDSKAYEILKNIALFESEVNINILEKITNTDKDSIEGTLESYIGKGIIVKRAEGDIYYDFHNKILKKLIYKKIAKAEKKDKHSIIADILKNDTYGISNEYLDEFIFHMEMSEQYEKVVDFCLPYVNQFEIENMTDMAIKYLRKAIEAAERDKEDIRLGEMLFRLGKLYKLQGKVDKAMNFYERSYEIAKLFKLDELKIKSLVKIGNFAFNKREMNKCEKCIKEIDELNGKLNLIKFTLDSNILKLRTYELMQKYDLIYKLCTESIDLCGEKHYKYKGKLYGFLGNLSYDKDKVQEAMKYYEESIKYFEKANDFKGTISPLNNIGIIWIEHYQDEEKSMECFMKIRDITEKNKYYESNIIALANIGENNLCMHRYEEALECFKEGLEKAKKIFMEGAVFYNYVYLTTTLFKLQNYKKALKYLKITNKELIKHPEQGNALMNYYSCVAEIMLTMGKIMEARHFIEKALQRSAVEDSISKWNIKFIREKINLLSSGDEDISPVFERVKKIIEKVIMKNSMANMILEFAEILINKAYFNEAAEVMKFLPEELELDRLKIRKNYLEALISEWGQRYDKLIEALALTKNCEDKETKWKICFEIGNYYYSLGEHFYAVNYYFQSAETVKILTESVDNQNRIDYFNFNHMYEPFYKLIEISALYNEDGEEFNGEYDRLKIGEAELKKLFMYEELKSILSNPRFIKSAQEIFDCAHNIKAYDKDYILSNLCNDITYNLNMIVEYVAREVLAKNAYIILEEYKKEIKVLAGNEISADKFTNKAVIDIVRSSSKPFLIVDSNFNDNENDMNIKNVVMCVPITQKNNVDTRTVSEEKRERLRNTKSILGYLYVEADRFINNLNENSINKVQEILPLAALLINKYLLQISSSIDKLTGTLTRKSLEEVLEEQYYECKNNGNTFSVIMFDMDHFKSINDKYGHQNGDEVLQKVGSLVINNIRKIDYCGRYGGEEFVIVLPDTSIEGANVVAEKLRTKIESERLLGEKMNVTISMGVSTFSQAASIKELIEKADKSLYMAKKLGRNRVQVWKEEFDEKVDASNKLTGIITGNDVQDYRNVSVIVELIELLKNKGTREEKIYSALGRIIEMTEAHQGSFIILENGRVKESFGRKIFTDGWQKCNFNKKIVKEITEAGKGRYFIDWDEVYGYDTLKGVPDWKSVLVVPIINNGDVKGLIYLSVSAKTKEFEVKDLNYVGMLAQILVSLI